MIDFQSVTEGIIFWYIDMQSISVNLVKVDFNFLKSEMVVFQYMVVDSDFANIRKGRYFVVYWVNQMLVIHLSA